MKFSINLGAWNSVFAVPSQVVDQHLKLAGGVHLKVLLWLLRHADREVDTADLSKALGVSNADIKDAVRYWADAGLIADFSCDCDHAALAPAPIPSAQTTDAQQDAANTPSDQAEAKPEEPAPAEAAKKAPLHMKKPDTAYLTQRMAQSETVSYLMQEAQQILGRTLSPSLSSVLLMSHDDYGLPADVLIMLLMYVKSIHKDNTKYIEAVAKNWAQEEINTHEKADEKLRQLSAVASSWRSIEQALGMNHRSPSAKEEQYTQLWIHQWGFTIDMIRQAYERCVNATGERSLHYMNKILERWHKAGIATPEQAALEDSKKAAGNKAKNKNKATYDLEEYENTDLSEFM